MAYVQFTWIVFTLIVTVLDYANSASCDLPISNGGGEGCPTQTVWSYDKELDECIYEEYSGCELSGNQFKNRHTCYVTCVKVPNGYATKKKPVCDLPRTDSVTGPCNYESVWSYDKATDECLTFEYAGCKIEGNMFKKYGDCRFQCVQATSTVVWPTASKCALPLIKGSGCGQQTMYSFIQEESRCIPRTFSGCDLNGNVFDKITDCIHDCQAGNLTSYVTYDKRLNACKFPISNAVETRCDIGTRVYSYNRHKNVCDDWEYYGCEVTGNKFRGYSECLEKCVNPGRA